MSIYDFKNVVRGKLTPEFEELLKKASGEVQEVEKNDVVFEYSCHGNFFFIKRYEVIYRCNKYVCFCNIHLMVMGVNNKNLLMTLSTLMPPKFLFRHFIHGVFPIDINIEMMLDKHFINNYEIQEEYLLRESSKNDGFVGRASEVIKKWGCDKADTFILAPQDWVYGVIKNIKTIAQNLRNEGSKGWVEIL